MSPLDRLLLASALLSAAACSAFRPPAQDDPDRSRHAYEVVGELRMRDTGGVVAGAAIVVTGAREVAGSRTTDATGRFWFRVSDIGGGVPDRAGVGHGPAGMILVSARKGRLCAPETKVLLPASGPVLLAMAPCY